MLLLHLSDIHIKKTHNPILDRTPRIVDAIKNIDPDTTHCAVAISGDVAFSGSEDEYLLALNFIDELKSALEAGFDHKVAAHVVVIPGNHDCNFAGHSPARAKFIEAISRDNGLADTPEMMQACLGVQSNFFYFAQSVNRELWRNNPYDVEARQRLFYEYRLEAGGFEVLYHCYNTAWLSQLGEKQGQLMFPLSLMPDSKPSANILVTLFHHPYGWLESNNARAFRKNVEKYSDLILTGHEHDHTYSKRYGPTGEFNQYIEGGALQDSSDDNSSSFNVVLLDLSNQRQKFFHFLWEGSFYDTAKVPVGWEPFQGNRLRLKRDFELTHAFQEQLLDAGVYFSHRGVPNVKLSDIYVYPELRKYTDQGKIDESIESEDCLTSLLAYEKMLILGQEQSGKTALAKRIFSELLDRNYVPIYISGAAVNGAKEDYLDGIIEVCIQEQYDLDAVEKYRQLDRSRKAVILDDLHLVDLNLKGKNVLIAELLKRFGRVIVLSDSMRAQLEEALSRENGNYAFWELKRLEITEFGYYLREVLINKWFGLGESLVDDEFAIARKLETARRTVDAVVGKNFVPSLPIYILSVLQMLETATPVNTEASDYGYYYEVFIRQALARTGVFTGVSPGTRTNYLSYLAMHFFNNRLRRIEIDEFREVHKEFERIYNIDLDFSEMRDVLCQARILENRGSCYDFRYNYIYYYFVASFLRDHLTDVTTRGIVTSLAKRLYNEEYSNILLFLSHLSKDPFIIQEIVRNAALLFQDIEAITLDAKDIAVFGDLQKPIRELVIANVRPEEVRKEIAKNRDAMNAKDRELEETFPKADADDDKLEPILKLNVALKSMQIMGQVLKNFPGELPGHVKESLAQECYELSLRSLKVFFDTLNIGKDFLLDRIVRLIRERHPSEDDQKIVERSQEAIFNLALSVSLGMILRTSQAIGHEQLTNTYRDLLKKHPILSYKLIDVAIKLDLVNEFPEVTILGMSEELKDTNFFGFSLLRKMTVRHFMLFPVDYRQKQTVTKALGIKYTQSAFRSTTKKLR
jgi:hypothetical protein